MLVLWTDSQLLSPRVVCQNCLMADHNGLPRWQQGKLGCGRSLDDASHNQIVQYECQMGFRVANID